MLTVVVFLSINIIINLSIKLFAKLLLHFCSCMCCFAFRLMVIIDKNQVMMLSAFFARGFSASELYEG